MYGCFHVNGNFKKKTLPRENHKNCTLINIISEIKYVVGTWMKLKNIFLVLFNRKSRHNTMFGHVFGLFSCFIIHKIIFSSQLLKVNLVCKFIWSNISIVVLLMIIIQFYLNENKQKLVVYPHICPIKMRVSSPEHIYNTKLSWWILYCILLVVVVVCQIQIRSPLSF